MFDSPCDICQLIGEFDCENCYLANPCYGCLYENNGCIGQCYFGEEVDIDVNDN